MSKKRPPTRGAGPRAVRRAADREAVKLARDVRRLEELEPGGAPSRPIELTSASEVEPAALARPCPICRAALRLEAHEVDADAAGARLRVARLTCAGCRAPWARWFRIGPPPAN